MAFYNALRALALKVLSQILGGLALILLAGSLLIVYGGSVW
jgi:hypothetical protein